MQTVQQKSFSSQLELIDEGQILLSVCKWILNREKDEIFTSYFMYMVERLKDL